jgi:hypothetical protein
LERFSTGITDINLLNLQRLGLRKIDIYSHGVISDNFNVPVGFRRPDAGVAMLGLGRVNGVETVCELFAK